MVIQESVALKTPFLLAVTEVSTTCVKAIIRVKDKVTLSRLIMTSTQVIEMSPNKVFQDYTLLNNHNQPTSVTAYFYFRNNLLMVDNWLEIHNRKMYM